MYPKYTPSQQKGSIGSLIVDTIVTNHFRWIFKKNPQETDYGIDGQIELVNNAGDVTGQAFAFQVKYGKSYVKRKNQWGYEYSGKQKHFNYFANYPLSVLIIVCDPEDDTCYFEFFDKNTAQLMDSSWKMTIPFDNVLIDSKERIAAALPPSKEYWPELREYWKIHEIILDSEIILLRITEEHLLNGDTKLAEAFFQSLSRSREIADHSRGRVELIFHGYDEDLRELYAIDEVKSYLKRLAAKVDSLLFFFRIEERCTSLRLVTACCSDATDSGKRAPGGEIIVTGNIDAIAEFVKLQQVGFKELCNWLNMPTDKQDIAFWEAAQLIGVDKEFLKKYSASQI